MRLPTYSLMLVLVGNLFLPVTTFAMENPAHFDGSNPSKRLNSNESDGEELQSDKKKPHLESSAAMDISQNPNSTVKSQWEIVKDTQAPQWLPHVGKHLSIQDLCHRVAFVSKAWSKALYSSNPNPWQGKLIKLPFDKIRYFRRCLYPIQALEVIVTSRNYDDMTGYSASSPYAFSMLYDCLRVPRLHALRLVFDPFPGYASDFFCYFGMAFYMMNVYCKLDIAPISTVEISGLYPENPEQPERIYEFLSGNLFFEALYSILSKTKNLTLTNWCPSEHYVAPLNEIETLETLTLCVDQASGPNFDCHGWYDIFGTKYFKTLKIQRGKLFRPSRQEVGSFVETDVLNSLLDSDPETGRELSKLETLVLEDCEFHPDWKNDDGNISKLFEELFKVRPTLREIHLLKNKAITKFLKDNTNKELLPG